MQLDIHGHHSLNLLTLHSIAPTKAITRAPNTPSLREDKPCTPILVLFGGALVEGLAFTEEIPVMEPVRNTGDLEEPLSA